jgi:hypothetical protein
VDVEYLQLVPDDLGGGVDEGSACGAEPEDCCDVHLMEHVEKNLIGDVGEGFGAWLLWLWLGAAAVLAALKDHADDGLAELMYFFWWMRMRKVGVEGEDDVEI